MSEERTPLPIKVDSTSNGEYAPIPLDPAAACAVSEADAAVDAAARRLNTTRRQFLHSACGAALTLSAMGEAFARSGARGGRYQLAPEAGFETAAAEAAVGGDEFIFDIQLHHLNPLGDWRGKSFWEQSHKGFPKARDCDKADTVACFAADQLIQDVFVDSDTDLAVLSMVPAEPGLDPLTNADARATAELVDRLEGHHRLLLHAKVQPNVPGEVDQMDEIARDFNVAAWKLYTQFGGPDGKGFFLDDEIGLAVIEKSRALGIRNICIHKGIPFGPQSYEHATCRDVGVVAARYPDMNFILYHSGFEPQRGEREYRREDRWGVNILVDSLEEHGIGRHRNVYAELGSTWRFCMRDPDMAAHLLGKLIGAVGENNVLWGTDSIWYGSPQDQIQAFRAFQISDEFQARYGYPELTPAIKRKIFGLNATVPYGIDAAEVERLVTSKRATLAAVAPRDRGAPHFQTYGPRNRREYLRLLAASGGRPA